MHGLGILTKSIKNLLDARLIINQTLSLSNKLHSFVIITRNGCGFHVLMQWAIRTCANRDPIAIPSAPNEKLMTGTKRLIR
jgi:hypothetical protein